MVVEAVKRVCPENVLLSDRRVDEADDPPPRPSEDVAVSV
jgi:hypothetical protein